MRRAVLIAAVLALIAPGSALARECGIPDSNPLWVDFAGHDAPLPQKPGLTLAFTSGTVKPAEARQNGAATVFFDLNFNNRVGTPTVPADPALIQERADRLYDFAVSVTGCQTPWIALNELFGAQTPTPWTTTTAQYRANTLALVRRLKERGAFPAVTIANPPYTGGEAAQWWRDLAASALLIRQVFFTSPNVPQLHALGPMRASRAMRSGMRALVRKFTDIGIPASRVALELQFQSAPGTGGREGLQPRAKWLEIVKLQALAARRVTKELRTHSIWSWGWATFSAGGNRPRQGRGRLRLPVGPRPEALQRARRRRSCDGRVADRRPARAARGRRRLRPTRRRDPEERRRPAGPGDRRPRHRRERRAGAARAPAGGRAGRARGAGGGARLRRRPLQRQRGLVPGCTAADPADARRGARAAAGRAQARRRPGTLLLPPSHRRRGRGVPHHLRGPAVAARRDPASRRLARRQDAWDRGRDLRPGAHLRPRPPGPRPHAARADPGDAARRHGLSRHDPARRTRGRRSSPR